MDIKERVAACLGQDADNINSLELLDTGSWGSKVRVGWAWGKTTDYEIPADKWNAATKANPVEVIETAPGPDRVHIKTKVYDDPAVTDSGPATPKKAAKKKPAKKSKKAK